VESHPQPGTLFGIGIDVVEVSRIQSSLDEFGETFLKRIFSPEEIRYCKSQKNPPIHYAARFAAKEAVSKALGTGIGKDVSWTDIAVIRKDSGEPYIQLSGNAEKFAQTHHINHIKISLTHTNNYAAANAIALHWDFAT